MNEHVEWRKIQSLAGTFVVCLITGFWSLREFPYVFRGRTADAIVSRATENHFGQGIDRVTVMTVDYDFTDATGVARSESDKISTRPITGLFRSRGWRRQFVSLPQPNAKLTIEYLPGVPDSSRVVGNDRLFSVWLFLGSLFLLVSSYLWLQRTAKAPIAKNCEARKNASEKFAR